MSLSNRGSTVSHTLRNWVNAFFRFKKGRAQGGWPRKNRATQVHYFLELNDQLLQLIDVFRWDLIFWCAFSWFDANSPLVVQKLQPDKMSEPSVADTRRLNSKPQDLTDAYGPPSNFLEIDVYDPQTVGVGRNRYTTYEVRMRVGVWGACQSTLLQH